VVSLPDGLDPDDVIKKRGKDAFMKLLDEALPLVEYKLALCEKLLDGTLDGRTAYAQKALDVLSDIEVSVEREAYLPMIREKSGLSLDSLKRDLYDPNRQKVEQTNSDVITVSKPKNGDTAYYTSARYVLSAMLSQRDYVWTGESLVEYFVLSTHKDVYNYCVLCHEAGKDIIAGNLYGVVDDEELDAILSTPLSQGEDESEASFFALSVSKLRKAYLDKSIASITDKIKATTDENEKKTLLTELNNLVIQSKKI
jgi:DNA primase